MVIKKLKCNIKDIFEILKTRLKILNFLYVINIIKMDFLITRER